MCQASDEKRAGDNPQKRKGQIDTLSILPETEIAFRKENSRLYLVKISKEKPTGRFTRLWRVATVAMSTDEMMDLPGRENKWCPYNEVKKV